MDIRELDSAALLATGRPGDMALSMLARGGAGRLHEILERAKLLPPTERGRVFSQLAMLSGLLSLENQLKMELRAMDKVYMSTDNHPVLQDWIGIGASGVLRRLLERKFGSLPGWAIRRLEYPSRSEVDAWTDRLLTASTLEGVFAPES